MEQEIVRYIRTLFSSSEHISLHEPCVGEREKQYLGEVIDSSFVSSVGVFVDRFEANLEQYLPAESVIAMVNGTSALHSALYGTGVSEGDLVITQPLTFVATANAVSFLGAAPIFVDVSKTTMGMCPSALSDYLSSTAYIDVDNNCRHKRSERKISACIAVHTFGHPVAIDDIKLVCRDWHIPLIEDASQALGSEYNDRKVGSETHCAVFSFNGNKIITSGAGGAVVSNSVGFGKKIKHISTTARLPGPEIEHDQIGFNYRMPNINAAVACAQLEQLDEKLTKKRMLAKNYQEFFAETPYEIFVEPTGCNSNYWLNVLLCNKKDERDRLIRYLNEHAIGARPAWKLLCDLPMYAMCEKGDVSASRYFYERVVCLPSSPHQIDF